MSAKSIAKSIHVAIVASGLMLSVPCWPQGAGQPGTDATFKEIVLLESAAAKAAEEHRYPAAIDNHSRALQLAEQLQRPRLTAVLLGRLGQDYEDANEIQRGLVAHEMALKALQRDPSLELSAVIRRLSTGGKSFDGRPDPIAPDLHRESVARDLETEEQDPALVIRILINIGNGYFRQPQEGTALRAYELALQQPEIDKVPLLKGHALANYGELLRRQGNTAEAESTLKSAITLIERNGSPEDTRRALTSLARLQAERSQTEEALALYGRAIVLYRNANDRRGEARAQLGKGYVEFGRNHVEPATVAFRRALELGEALADDDLRWQAHLGLGRSYKARGDLDRAATEYSASLKFVGDRERDLGTDEGKVAFVQQAQDAFTQLLLLQLDRAARDPARYVDALSVAEESRARALSRLMQGWTGDARPSPGSLGLTACYRPPRPPQARAECVSPRVPAMNQMARATAARPSDCEPGDPRLSAAQMAIATPDVAQMAVGTPGTSGPATSSFDLLAPPLPPGADLPPPRLPSSDVVLAALPRLVFHVLDDRLVVFAIRRDGRVVGNVVRMSAEEVAQRVSALRAALGVDRSARAIMQAADTVDGNARPIADARQALRALYAEWIAPVASGLPDMNDILVIEPHGPLWLVPFAALLQPDDHWFGDRYQLVYAPSASAMQELRRASRPEPRDTLRIFAIGNPIESSRPTAAGDPFRGTFAPLPGAEVEARQVSALFSEDRATLLVGTKANLEAVEKDARNHSILHFATHGLADPERPLDSFLLLATSATCEDRLSARRIMTLPLSADLVTMSACQTGLGKVSGEGVIGLSRAFFVAGARSVLVSLWSVSDEATRQLMTAFYGYYIRERMTKAMALARAMRDVRDSAEFKSPRYWAPFILIGSEM